MSQCPSYCTTEVPMDRAVTGFIIIGLVANMADGYPSSFTKVDFKRFPNFDFKELPW